MFRRTKDKKQAAPAKAAAPVLNQARLEPQVNTTVAEERQLRNDEDTARKDAWRAKLLKMSSSQSFKETLDKELVTEREEARKRLIEGQRVIQNIMADIAEMESHSQAEIEGKAEAIAALREEVASLVTVRAVVVGFDANVASLLSTTKEAHEELIQQSADALGVATRLHKEHMEATARLASAKEQRSVLEKNMAKLIADAAPQEKLATAELSRLTSAASVARLQSQLGARRCDALAAEEARLLDAAGEVARHEKRLARAIDVKAEVERLQTQIATDESELGRLSSEEQRIEGLVKSAAKRAVAAVTERAEALERVRKMGAAHGGFVCAATEQLCSVDTKTRALVDGMVAAITEKQAAADEAAAALAADDTERQRADAESDASHKRELRTIASEKQAVVAAKAERERFLLQQQKQLETLEKAAREAAGTAVVPVEGHDACLAMVQKELAGARMEASRLASLATEAEAARTAQQSTLDALKAKTLKAKNALRVQIESESCIVQEHEKAVASLAQRAAAAAQLEPSPDETACRERATALAEAGGVAAKAQVGAVDAAQRDADAALEAAMAAKGSLEARAATDVAALQESLSATREAVADLAGYEAALAELLSQNKLSSTATDGATEPPAMPDAIAISDPPSVTPPSLDELRASVRGSMSIIDHAASAQRASRAQIEKKHVSFGRVKLEPVVDVNSRKSE